MTERHKVITGILIFLLTIAFGVWQFKVLEINKTLAKELSTTSSELTTLSASLTDEYQTVKVDTAKNRETSAQELTMVFPSGEDMTNLNRMFDDFSMKNNFSGNPFFISEISYGSAETSENGNFRFVPITLEITSAEKNLSKFLEYIETSGSLEGGIRLMSAEKVTISYPSEYGGTFDSRIEINAYFAQEL